MHCLGILSNMRSISDKYWFLRWGFLKLCYFYKTSYRPRAAFVILLLGSQWSDESQFSDEYVSS